MASISPIRLVPDLTDQVYQRLLNAICDGDLAPGARLTQEELAATLAVSRQPVLQALRMLKKDGFVVDSGRRGLMVLPLGAQTISHLYEVRSALDGLAARQAALLKTTIDLGIIAEGRKAVMGTRIGTMIDADMRFHNVVYNASGNPLIAESARHHWQHIAAPWVWYCSRRGCAKRFGMNMKQSSRPSTAAMRNAQNDSPASTAKKPAIILFRNWTGTCAKRPDAEFA